MAGRPFDDAVPGPGGTDGHRPGGRHSGDAWVECACGRRHWGVHGAAGLLLHRRGPDDGRHEVVLQHRALWSDQGGTWALPGGALAPGETPVDGAVREAAEEAGVDPGGLEVHDLHVLDHGPWRYTTVVARATGPQHVRPTDAESLEIAWVAVDAVDARPLLPAFAASWPALRRRLDLP
ncbi:NUDIX hydrolase [Actinotalea solisilvae]|uniref:NUDIX hydrolase n=1 Tax=Actinotalea solisilvae TaxID=2072922 RepID=UPI0018F1A656|nr:NUDIX hydrolase [Actinotalea solisilvae]